MTILFIEGKMKHILIIDDDIHINNMLDDILQQEGYRVSHAYSGTDRPYIEDGQHQAPQFAKFPKHISVLDIDALADCDAMYGCRTVSEYIFRPQFELFDLENDPEERKNLAEEPGYASVLDDLKMELQKFGERTSDPWMVKWFYE